MNEKDIPNSWQYSSDKKSITREYQFSSFKQAIDFIQKTSKHIEEMNHHPEWTNVFNVVKVQLSTHSKNTVTDKDLELAKIMNEVADEIQ